MPDDREIFESTDVTRLHLSAWVKALPFAWLILQVPRMLTAGVVDADLTALVSLGATATMIAILVFGLRRLNDRRAEPGRIRADRTGVHWNDKQVLSRAKITNGVVMPGIQSKRTQVAARVRLTQGRWKRAIEFGVRDEGQGRAMLRALGLDSSQVTASFRAHSRMAGGWLTFAIIIGISALLGAVMAIAPHNPLAAPFAAMAFLALLIPVSLPTTAVVGTDGVLLKWTGTRRYLPYKDIVSLTPDGTGALFTLRDGRTAKVEFGARRTGKAARERARIECETFVARVEQARAAAPTPETQVDPDTVARGERDVSTWLKSLRALTQNEGGMRSAPVLRDQLFGLVDDTRLDPSARAGAAAALGLGAAPSERERLRAVAATIAMPRLRVVVEAAADGDEKKLRDALDEVRDESERTRVVA